MNGDIIDHIGRDSSWVVAGEGFETAALDRSRDIAPIPADGAHCF